MDLQRGRERRRRGGENRVMERKAREEDEDK